MNQTAIEPILLEVDDGGTVELEVSEAIIVNHIDGDMYEGSYDVTPTFGRQYLETCFKTMQKNVTIQPISVSRTQNLAGGTTIYIGG